jgi:hypothetical protein
MQRAQRFAPRHRNFRGSCLLASASFIDLNERIQPRLQFGDPR